MSDPIRDELHRLSEEFRKLAELPTSIDVSQKINSEQLTEDNIVILMNKFGLTYNQAKAWLEQEPNFLPNRRIFTEDKSDEDFTESDFRLCYLYD